MDILRPLTHNEVAIIPDAPSVGNVVMYAYNGLMYAKDSAGNITQMQGGVLNSLLKFGQYKL